MFNFIKNRIKKETLTKQDVSIVEKDLAHIKHENLGYMAERTILLVSTPRSGSTMLATDIDPHDGGPMAEYFQPYQVMPYLMKERKIPNNNGEVDPKGYADYLANFRSGSQKCLCIKLHSVHMASFNRTEGFLPKIDSIFIILRKDIVSQAVSYFLAKKTNRWTHAYDFGFSSKDVEFSYEGIKHKLTEIFTGLNYNLARFNEYNPKIINYENYVSGGDSFAEFLGLKKSQLAEVRTQKQSNSVNIRFKKKFEKIMYEKCDVEMIDKISMYDDLVGRLKSVF